MHTRALAAVMTIMLATDCAEWVPASVAEASGQERVRVQRPVSLEEPPSVEAEHGVVTSELASPSRRTLQRLRREGAYFEVRHSNAATIALPVTLAMFGVAVLAFVGVAVAGHCEPFVDIAAVARGLPRPP